MKRIVLGCSSSNGDYDGGCEYALVELTREFCKKALDRIALCQQLHQQDTDLLEMYYWGNVAFFGPHADPDGNPHWNGNYAPMTSGEYLTEDHLFFGDFDSDFGLAELSPELHIPNSMMCSTECIQMVVHYDGDIWFTCYPRHSSVTITTKDLSKQMLEEALAEQEVAQ